MAEVFGDLGGAPNVAVIVPGMDNEMANFDGSLRALGQNLAGTAGPTTAAISWLGYDTPEGIDGAFGCVRDSAARRLTTFVESLSAYGDRHTTVIGHRYGSTVVAGAAADHGLPADDLVFVGSPGISQALPDPDNRQSLSGYGLWYGETGRDFVSDWAYTFHGEGPKGYGAQGFSTGGATGHSEYFEPDTDSPATWPRSSPAIVRKCHRGEESGVPDARPGRGRRLQLPVRACGRRPPWYRRWSTLLRWRSPMA